MERVLMSGNKNIPPDIDKSWNKVGERVRMFDGGYGVIGNQDLQDRKGNADLQKIKKGTEANNEFQLKNGTPAGLAAAVGPAGLAAAVGPAGLAAAEGPPEVVGMMTVVAAANNDYQMMEDEDNNCHTEGQLITQSTGGGGQPVDNPNREVCKLNSQHYMDNYEYPVRNDKLRDNMVVGNNAQNDGNGDWTDVRGGQNIVENMDEDNTPSKNGKWNGKGGRDGQNEITRLDNECRVLNGIVKNRGSGNTGNGMEEGTEMETKNHCGNGEDINMGDQVECIERGAKNHSIHIDDNQSDIETDSSKKNRKQNEIEDDLSGEKNRYIFEDGDQVNTKMDAEMVTSENLANPNLGGIEMMSGKFSSSSIENDQVKNLESGKIIGDLNGIENGVGFVKVNVKTSGMNGNMQNFGENGFGDVQSIEKTSKGNGDDLNSANPQLNFGDVLNLSNPQLENFVEGYTRREKQNGNLSIPKNLLRYVQQRKKSAKGKNRTAFKNRKSRDIPVIKKFQKSNRGNSPKDLNPAAVGTKGKNGEEILTPNKKRKTYSSRVENRSTGREAEILNGEAKINSETAADMAAGHAAQTTSRVENRSNGRETEVLNGNGKNITRTAAAVVADAAVVSGSAAQSSPPSFADILKGNEKEEEVTKMEYFPPALDATGC